MVGRRKRREEGSRGCRKEERVELMREVGRTERKVEKDKGKEGDYEMKGVKMTEHGKQRKRKENKENVEGRVSGWRTKVVRGRRKEKGLGKGNRKEERRERW